MLVLEADEVVVLAAVAVVPLATKEANINEDDSPDSSNGCLMPDPSSEFEISKETS